MRKSFRKLAVLCALSAACVGGAVSVSQEPGKEAPKAVASQPAAAAKPVRHFLPPFWSKIVSADQRKAVYAIEDTYAPQFAALEAQLDALKAKRLAEMAGVLTAPQRERVMELAIGKSGK